MQFCNTCDINGQLQAWNQVLRAKVSSTMGGFRFEASSVLHSNLWTQNSQTMDKLPLQSKFFGVHKSHTQPATNTFFNLLYFSPQLTLLIDLILQNCFSSQNRMGPRRAWCLISQWSLWQWMIHHSTNWVPYIKQSHRGAGPVLLTKMTASH